jgi:hypothetical protein
MIALTILILLLIVILGLFLIGRAGFVIFSKPTEEQRINRSIGAGIGAILFTIGSLLLIGLFNNKSNLHTNSIYNVLQGLCFGLCFMLVLGSVVSVGMYFQIKYGETLLRGTQRMKEQAKEIFERDSKK